MVKRLRIINIAQPFYLFLVSEYQSVSELINDDGL